MIAYLGTFLVLGGMTLESRRYASVGDPLAFHARVRRAVDNYPTRIGAWSGTESRVPQAATDLLQPNAIFATQFQNLDDERVVSVVLIQCADSRDMQGHYPPVCYPNSGWTPVSQTNREIDLWGRRIAYAEYVFEMSRGVSNQRVLIANFFVLPGDRFVVSMDDVREASADYRVRPFGAGQIQVMFHDASMPREQRESAMRELLEPLGEAARAMLQSPEETEKAS